MRASTISALASAALAAAAPSQDLAESHDAATTVSMNHLFPGSLQTPVDVNVTEALLSKRSSKQGIYLAHCKDGNYDMGLFVMYYPDITIATNPGVTDHDSVAWSPPKTDYKTSCVGHNVKVYSSITKVTTGFNIGADWGNHAVGAQTGTAWNDYGLHMKCYRGTDHTYMVSGSTVCIDWQHCIQDN